MAAAELRLYDLLKVRMGKEEAEAFMAALEDTVDRRFDMTKANLATKEDIYAVKEDLHAVKVDILKWVFAFWITLVLLIIGTYLKQ